MEKKNDEKQTFTKKENWGHLIKFTLFSISAGVIQFGTFSLLYLLFGETHWWGAYLPALILSVLWNFTLNRKFTFKSAANIPVAMMKVAGYYLVFTPLSTYGGNFLELDLGWNGFIVTLIAMVLNFVTEFIFTKYFVYKNQINTALDANKKA